MSAPQYDRLKQKIRASSNSSSTSIWLALALMFVGVAATLWVTIFATNMEPAVKGKLELAGWFSIVLVLLLAIVHITKYAQHRSEVDDIVEEMDTYIYHRAD